MWSGWLNNFENNFGEATLQRGFPGGTSGKELVCQCRRCKRHILISGSGRSPGGGHGNALQDSCLENSMDKIAWWAKIHEVAKSWARLSDWTYTHTFQCIQCGDYKDSDAIRMSQKCSLSPFCMWFKELIYQAILPIIRVGSSLMIQVFLLDTYSSPATGQVKFIKAFIDSSVQLFSVLNIYRKVK